MEDNNGWTKIEKEPSKENYYDVYMSDGSIYKEVYYDEDGFDFGIDQSIVEYLGITVTHYRIPYEYEPPIF